MTDQQAVAAAGGTQLAPQGGTSPGLAGFMNMLGMGGGGTMASAAPPAAAPVMTPAGTTPIAGGLPPGSMNPMMGLGITGQKAQQGQVPGMAASAAPQQMYVTPQPQNTRASASILGVL